MSALANVCDADVTYLRRGTQFRALTKASLAIQPGERVGLVGGSGSGKTTLARLMLALVRPSAGEVYFEGQRVDSRPERELGELRARASMIFQDPRSSLNPRMRVEDIVAEPLRSPLLRGRADVPTANAHTLRQALAEVDLEEALLSRYPHQLSGGQRQRVAIARALVSHPSLLIADEPVSALDVSVRAQVINLLAEQAKSRGLALVFVSHDLAVVRHLCDRMVVLQAGRIVESGPTQKVFAKPAHPYTQALLDATLSL